MNEILSKPPVPGGGGASACIEMLGMALGSMMGNPTRGRKEYRDAGQDIQELLKESERIMRHLGKLEKENYRGNATLLPLDIAECCLKVIELHEAYAIKGSRLAISDVGVGVEFCKAALEEAKLNALYNTETMKDRKLKRCIEGKLREIEKKGMAKADKILQYLEVVLRQNNSISPVGGLRKSLHPEGVQAINSRPCVDVKHLLQSSL